jgi:hypothetical protein
MKFLQRARWLYRIVLVQHATRLILRAAWLGGAVYLFCWGANSLWGVLPRSGYWVFFSVVVGLVTILAILIRPLKLDDFLWRVDNKFEQKEQIATAYEVTQDVNRKPAKSDSLEGMLLSDAAEILPEITRRVIDKGWKLRNDVEATVIVLMLLMIVYLSGMESFGTSTPRDGLGLLPGPGSDPSFFDVFASGIPGDTSGNSAGLLEIGAASQGIDPAAGGQGLSAEGLDLVYQVFKRMGADLKDGAATAAFGGALEAGDFEQAANHLGSLSENVDRLTVGTRQSLADAFSYGERELYLSEFAEISDSLGGAADALEGNSLVEMSNRLNRVVEMLDAFAAQQRGDVYAREEYVAPAPIESERLEGEGEELEVKAVEDVSDILVAPGGGFGGTGNVLDDVVNLIGSSSYTFGIFNLTSYDFSWEDKDVVSSYFSPR